MTEFKDKMILFGNCVVPEKIYFVENRGAPGKACDNGGFTALLSETSGMTGNSR